MTDVQSARPRWTALPGDPPALRRWLAAQAAPAGSTEPGSGLPEDWPQEES
jgi:hypothetical protein